MTSIGDRLARARRRRFVGRCGERELFRAALVAPEPPFAVLFVHGPGGIGKTALLDAFARTAEEQGVPAVRVDARSFEPSPAAFTAAVADAFGEPADVLTDRPAGGERRVLLIDTFERAAHLDAWLRETFLPGLSAAVTVVIAGRQPPAPGWRADPGWHELLRVVSLRNLRPEESLEYLTIEGLGERERAQVVALTHGHPLAMSLYVDLLAQRRGEAGAQTGPAAAATDPAAPPLPDSPDVVATLVGCFVDEVPTERHRAALSLAARVRYTDEGILAAALGAAAAPELLAWLRGLSFMERDARGVFPHDLAREVLDADLRWRDRSAFEDLHHRARAHVLERVRRTDGLRQQHAAADLAFLHRSNPVMGGFLDWSAFGHAWADRLAPGEAGTVLSMIEQHQGTEQARLAERWMARQPEGFIVARDRLGRVRGAAAMLRLDHAAPADIAHDPGTAAAWQYAQRHRPPREHDAVTVARFFVDRESNQAVPSVTLNVISVWHTQHIINTPALSWDFIVAYEHPEAMEPLFSYIYYDRVPGADYEVGGRRYGAFAHDWRRMPLAEWLDATGRQEISDEPPPARAATAETSTMALSQPEFAAAVRSALRDLHRPDRLARNPLVRSRVIGDRTHAGDDPAGKLRDLVHQAVETLRSHPKDEKLYRVLDRTYLRPAPTQEAAMEILDLPSSTYRRHLGRGVERVVAWLWERDVYGPAQGQPVARAHTVGNG